MSVVCECALACSAFILEFFVCLLIMKVERHILLNVFLNSFCVSYVLSLSHKQCDDVLMFSVLPQILLGGYC